MDTSSPINSTQEIDQGGLVITAQDKSTTLSTLLREEYGRTVNTTNDSYHLPADHTEWLRLDKQNMARNLACNGLYPCPDIIEATLHHTGETTKQILDLGCGSGFWAIEMAIKFPHAIVTAVDMAPLPHDTSKLPPNFHFFIMDINDGLSEFRDKYDLIHWSGLSTGIKDVKKTVQEVQLALKPGCGVCLMIEGDIELEDTQDHKVKMAKMDGDEDVSGVSEEGSWFNRIFFEAVEASMSSDSDRNVLEFIDHGLWDQPLLDPDTAINGGIYLPIGPWAHSDIEEEDQTLKHIGALMQDVILRLHRATHPVMLRYGIQQKVIDEMSRRTDEQLEAMNTRFCARFQFCCARRRAGEGLPASPLSQTFPDTKKRMLHVSQGHPSTIVTYHTQQEAWRAWEKRRESSGVKPVPLIRKL